MLVSVIQAVAGVGCDDSHRRLRMRPDHTICISGTSPPLMGKRADCPGPARWVGRELQATTWPTSQSTEGVGVAASAAQTLESDIYTPQQAA